MLKNNFFLKTIAICLMALSIYSCKDRVGAPLTVEVKVKSIYEYLKTNPSYSTLVAALDLTGLSPSMNLYGSMTLFAPTNDAFQKYFTYKGIKGISQMNVDTLRQILKYHIYGEKYAASLFPVSVATISGDLIEMDISKGIRNTLLNGTVKIDTIDLSATNGYIHVIDDVLQPPKNTIYNYLSGNPDYSIMAEAISKTGLDTALLNKVIYNNSTKTPTKNFVTFFAETNAVLSQKGINSFDDLAKKFSNTYQTTKNYSSKTDSLNIFIRYHCLKNKYYILDFIDDVYETASWGNWVIIDTKDGVNLNRHFEKQSVLNPATGKYELQEVEAKISLVSGKSNIVTSNGIVHSIGDVLKVRVAKPTIVKAYFGGAPKDRAIKLPDGSLVTFFDMFAKWKDDPVSQKMVWWLKWGFNAGTVTKVTPLYDASKPSPIYKADYPMENMDGLMFSNANGLWLEITTKPIFPGQYYIYIYESNMKNTHNSYEEWKFTWSLDGVQDPAMTDFNKVTDNFGRDVRMFTENFSKNEKTKIFLLGIVTFDKIQTHTVKIEMVDENKSPIFWKIQFNPVQ